MKRLICLLLALTVSQAPAIEPRSPGTPIYTVYKETSLSGAAEVITIRIPTGINKTAYMIDVDLYCSVACEITIEKNGTFSSGTTITPNPGRTSDGASSITATYGTSIASTTVKSKKYLAAGETLPLDLVGIFLVDTNDALTFRTSSITGIFTCTARYEQK